MGYETQVSMTWKWIEQCMALSTTGVYGRAYISKIMQSDRFMNLVSVTLPSGPNTGSNPGEGQLLNQNKNIEHLKKIKILL